MNKLSRVELQAQDGIIPDLHPNKQMKTVILGMLEPICMHVCTGKEYTGMNDHINKQRNKFNQFLIDKQITKFMPPQKPNNHLLL